MPLTPSTSLPLTGLPITADSSAVIGSASSSEELSSKNLYLNILLYYIY